MVEAMKNGVGGYRPLYTPEEAAEKRKAIAEDLKAKLKAEGKDTSFVTISFAPELEPERFSGLRMPPQSLVRTPATDVVDIEGLRHRGLISDIDDKKAELEACLRDVEPNSPQAKKLEKQLKTLTMLQEKIRTGNENGVEASDRQVDMATKAFMDQAMLKASPKDVIAWTEAATAVAVFLKKFGPDALDFLTGLFKTNKPEEPARQEQPLRLYEDV